VSKGQEALDKKLGMLETHQKDIHDALVNIENDASRLYLVRVVPC
jgi:nuclear pore complex protein Nup62